METGQLAAAAEDDKICLSCNLGGEIESEIALLFVRLPLTG